MDFARSTRRAQLSVEGLVRRRPNSLACVGNGCRCSGYLCHSETNRLLSETLGLFLPSSPGNKPGPSVRSYPGHNLGGQFMPSRLYVGNLAYAVSGTDLEELFSQAGEVQSATVISDKFSGQSKGFGFVEMAKAEDAAQAI